MSYMDVNTLKVTAINAVTVSQGTNELRLSTDQVVDIKELFLRIRHLARQRDARW